MSNRKCFRLHDSAIMGIVRAMQQGLLTGTDITDHMRLMRFEAMRDDADTLQLTEEYLSAEESALKSLVDEADRLQSSEDEPGNDDLPVYNPYGTDTSANTVSFK